MGHQGNRTSNNRYGDIQYCTIVYFLSDWTAVESGCYTPFYVEQPESLGTENNPVRPLEPVVVMASEHSYDIINPGYDAGRARGKVVYREPDANVKQNKLSHAYNFMISTL